MVSMICEIKFGGVVKVVMVRILIIVYLWFLCSVFVLIRLVCFIKVRMIGNWNERLNVVISVRLSERYFEILIWVLIWMVFVLFICCWLSVNVMIRGIMI